MPMPLSLTVNVPAALSGISVTASVSEPEERGVGEGLEAQLLAGVRGVRDQLAQEDLLVRVQRVNHEPQYLLGLGLEFFDLWLVR